MDRIVYSLIILFLFLTTALVGCSDPHITFDALAESESFRQEGEGTTTTYQRQKTDILWVIDNSGSMETSQKNVAQNFSSFIEKFKDNGVDYQIAVTTTDAYKGLPQFKDQPDLLDFRDGNKSSGSSGYSVITPQTPDITSAFIKNVVQGISGAGDERAFFSMKSVLENPENQGFFRDDSFLAIIIVGDEDDYSHEGRFKITEDSPDLDSIDKYIQFLSEYTQSTPDVPAYSVSAIAIFDEKCRSELASSDFEGRVVAHRYAALVDASGGKRASLCSDFADTFQAISETILQLATQFPLSFEPRTEELYVYVNGQLIPKRDTGSDNLDGGWTYNKKNNSIVFHGRSIPPEGSTITVSYYPSY